MHIRISLCIKFTLNKQFSFEFFDQICLRKIFLHIQISLVENFSSNWQFFFFGSNLHKKTFPVKTWKSFNRKNHHWIQHIQISLLVPNFCFNWQFWFFWPDLSKKGFSGLKQKKWTPHIFYIIVHIQISLVRNFTSDNFDFWTKFAQKGISSRKQKKWASPWNSAYWNKSRYKISTETDNFEVLDQM